jgi:hypothetical protein
MLSLHARVPVPGSCNMGTTDGSAANDHLPRLSPSVSRNGYPSSAGESHDSRMDENSNPSRPQLKFVTTTGPPSLRSREARLVVRSHAMQAFLRDKKAEAKGDTRRGPEENTTTLDDSIGRFKLTSWSRNSSKKVPPKARNQKFQRQNVINNNLTEASVAKRKPIERTPPPVRAT